MSVRNVRCVVLTSLVCVAMLIVGCRKVEDPAPVAVAPPMTDPFVVVLGIAQDGGFPHAGCEKPCCTRVWNDPSAARNVVSLGVVDPSTKQRWILEATPDFRAQLHDLEGIMPRSAELLDGILLTHAHIGHYPGLMFLGREAMGASEVPVYAAPRMADFLENNGPWNQLVRLGNIAVQRIDDGESFNLNDRLTATPIVVPHRDEYSETVGYRLDGPSKSVLFIPDVDKWERMSIDIEALIADVEVAYLDGSFFADGELPGRAMAEIPHPFIAESIERFATLAQDERAKIRFIHLNHSNPALDPESEASATIRKAGMSVAEEGERVGL
ncbi:MAG: pyrroloquinoline quinone biosynthesis protein PqqB [bacterium]|nr:pyrroloquinoline quinone biosynthesis protein PqqB [bacterium]